MTSLKAFYQEENPNQHGAVSPGRSRLFVEWAGSGKTVLDIGCADGHDGALLIANGNIVHGIDVNERELAAAAQKGLITQPHDVSAGELPYADATFDVVVASDIIEHLVDTDAFLAGIRRVLKLGGILIVSTPNVASFGRRMMLLAGLNPYLEYSLEETVAGAKPVGHLRYFTASDLSRLLRKHGFEVREMTSNGLNLFLFTSPILGRLLPRLGVSLWVKAAKTS